MSLINEEEVKKRLNSPLNLINRMKNGLRPNEKRANAMSLFIKPNISKEEELIPSPVNSVPAKFNPFPASELPAKKESVTSLENHLETSDAVDDIDVKIKLALAHDNALALMNKAIGMASSKLDDVDAEKIPAIINAASKVVESIRRERIERDKNYKNDQHVHHHFYMPEQKKLADYDVIEVSS